MSYTEFDVRYSEILDAVVNDREEVAVIREGHESVVVVAFDDYQSLKETAYLLRSPENARRLITAIERLESGAQ
ncbi:MAG TPA: type II toxin-antitoxin system prevent-host-death family antitoxin [Actinokineospora sp.]|nr:type II toxin-antitoxin system prevent-host-death family antitoxin [Actinokineospora sp.]